MICHSETVTVLAFLGRDPNIFALTRTDKVSAQSLSEIVENPVPVLLIHLGVNVETTVAELCNLLGKKFHSLGRVTEDYRLVDL